MSKRPYEQRLRAESAGQTRRRILDAAYQRLTDAPSQALNIDGIARDARVSRSTIYTLFGGRAELFDAVSADLLQRSGFDEVMRAVDDSDARAALPRFLRATVDLYAANRDVFRSLFAMAKLDPGATDGAIARTEAGRARGMQQLAERLADADLLRTNVTTTDGASMLWLLSSFDAFDLLASGQGQSSAQVATTLTRIAERAMLR